MKFEGEVVDVICEINQSLEDYVITTENGRGLMCWKLNKVVYGTHLGAYISERNWKVNWWAGGLR